MELTINPTIDPNETMLKDAFIILDDIARKNTPTSNPISISSMSQKEKAHLIFQTILTNTDPKNSNNMFSGLHEALRTSPNLNLPEITKLLSPELFNENTPKTLAEIIRLKLINLDQKKFYYTPKNFSKLRSALDSNDISVIKKFLLETLDLKLLEKHIQQLEEKDITEIKAALRDFKFATINGNLRMRLDLSYTAEFIPSSSSATDFLHPGTNTSENGNTNQGKLSALPHYKIRLSKVDAKFETVHELSTVIKVYEDGTIVNEAGRTFIFGDTNTRQANTLTTHLNTIFSEFGLKLNNTSMKETKFTSSKKQDSTTHNEQKNKKRAPNTAMSHEIILENDQRYIRYDAARDYCNFDEVIKKLNDTYKEQIDWANICLQAELDKRSISKEERRAFLPKDPVIEKDFSSPEAAEEYDNNAKSKLFAAKYLTEFQERLKKHGFDTSNVICYGRSYGSYGDKLAFEANLSISRLQFIRATFKNQTSGEEFTLLIDMGSILGTVAKIKLPTQTDINEFAEDIEILQTVTEEVAEALEELNKNSVFMKDSTDSTNTASNSTAHLMYFQMLNNKLVTPEINFSTTTKSLGLLLIPKKNNGILIKMANCYPVQLNDHDEYICITEGEYDAASRNLLAKNLIIKEGSNSSRLVFQQPNPLIDSNNRFLHQSNNEGRYYCVRITKIGEEEEEGTVSSEPRPELIRIYENGQIDGEGEKHDIITKHLGSIFSRLENSREIIVKKETGLYEKIHSVNADNTKQDKPLVSNNPKSFFGASAGKDEVQVANKNEVQVTTKEGAPYRIIFQKPDIATTDGNIFLHQDPYNAEEKYYAIRLTKLNQSGETCFYNERPEIIKIYTNGKIVGDDSGIIKRNLSDLTDFAKTLCEKKEDDVTPSPR